MLRLSLAFLVVALIAAMFGFGLIADFTFEAAKIVFVVFLVLAALAFIGNVGRGRSVDPI